MTENWWDDLIKALTAGGNSWPLVAAIGVVGATIWFTVRTVVRHGVALFQGWPRAASIHAEASRIRAETIAVEEARERIRDRNRVGADG